MSVSLAKTVNHRQALKKNQHVARNAENQSIIRTQSAGHANLATARSNNKSAPQPCSSTHTCVRSRIGGALRENRGAQTAKVSKR